MESIEPSVEVLSILRKWGIQTLGAVTSLGRNQIAERLGLEGDLLFERACARTARPLKLTAPPEVFEEMTEFEHEIESLEPLLSILRRFLDQLVSRLDASGWVVEALQLQLKLSSGATCERVFKVPAPTCDRDRLFRMLDTHLETLRTDSSISALCLKAAPCRAENCQFGLFEATLRDPNHFYETLARLTALLGAESVGKPILEQTHRPDAFHVQPADFVRARVSETPVKSSLRPGAIFWALALRRFRPPPSICVTWKDGRPVSITTVEGKKTIRVALNNDELRTLAEIGALNCFAAHRRDALWKVETPVFQDDLFGPAAEHCNVEFHSAVSPISNRQGLEKAEPVRADESSAQTTPDSPLQPMDASERLRADYVGMDLTTGPHPMALLRPQLQHQNIWRAIDLAKAEHGQTVRIAGNVICRQRPGTAKGFVFISLEDETGVSNAIVSPALFEKLGLRIIEEPFLLIEGQLQNTENVVLVKARRIERLPCDKLVGTDSHDFH